MNEIVQRAKEIIFSMEGSYKSVNCNDNGALSVGCCQWHGDRAKDLLNDIIKIDKQTGIAILHARLYSEVTNKTIKWSNRTLTLTEKGLISKLLDSVAGRISQNNQASSDIQNYITHVKNLGFMDEENIIFLADIENQGGAGSSNRIGRTALAKYGLNVTLDELLKVAINDKVFCKYQSRRLQVYKKLMKKDYKDQTAVTALNTSYYTVKSHDTLTAIATRFGTNVKHIMELNNIENKNIIIVGQRLKIEKEGVE